MNGISLAQNRMEVSGFPLQSLTPKKCCLSGHYYEKDRCQVISSYYWFLINEKTKKIKWVLLTQIYVTVYTLTTSSLDSMRCVETPTFMEKYELHFCEFPQ